MHSVRYAWVDTATVIESTTVLGHIQTAVTPCSHEWARAADSLRSASCHNRRDRIRGLRAPRRDPACIAAAYDAFNREHQGQ
jgi:hypothetical protein